MSSSSSRRVLRAIALALSLSLAAAGCALAQSSTAEEIADIKAQMAKLSQRLADVEARAGAEAPTPGAPKPATQPVDTRAPVTATRAAPSLTGLALRKRESANKTAVAVAPTDRALQSAGPAFQVSAVTGDSNVSLKLTRETTYTRNTDIAPDLHARQWTLTAKAPLSKGDGPSDLATLDSFASDFELRLGYTNYTSHVLNPLLDKASLQMESDARDACKAQADHMAKFNGDDAKAVSDKKGACDKAKGGGNLVRSYLGVDQETTYLDNIFRYSNAWGIEGHLGYRKHDFVDAASAMKGDEIHTPWGVRAYYAYLPKGVSVSYTGSIEYQHSFKDQDDGVVCPVAAGASVTCQSGAVGAPTRKEKLLLSGEWRKLYALDDTAWLKTTFGLGLVGVSAQATYDARSGTYGIDLPVYLVADDKAGLTGGLRVGWKSDTHDIIAGVFVGAAFSVQP